MFVTAILLPVVGLVIRTKSQSGARQTSRLATEITWSTMKNGGFCQIQDGTHTLSSSLFLVIYYVKPLIPSDYVYAPAWIRKMAERSDSYFQNSKNNSRSQKFYGKRPERKSSEWPVPAPTSSPWPPKNSLVLGDPRLLRTKSWPILVIFILTWQRSRSSMYIKEM